VVLPSLHREQPSHPSALSAPASPAKNKSAKAEREQLNKLLEERLKILTTESWADETDDDDSLPEIESLSKMEPAVETSPRKPEQPIDVAPELVAELTLKEQQIEPVPIRITSLHRQKEKPAMNKPRKVYHRPPTPTHAPAPPTEYVTETKDFHFTLRMDRSQDPRILRIKLHQ